jgi:hypothetical protein
MNLKRICILFVKSLNVITNKKCLYIKVGETRGFNFQFEISKNLIICIMHLVNYKISKFGFKI